MVLLWDCNGELLHTGDEAGIITKTQRSERYIISVSVLLSKSFGKGMEGEYKEHVDRNTFDV